MYVTQVESSARPSNHELEAVLELRNALNNKDERDERFWILDHGEGRDVP